MNDFTPSSVLASVQSGDIIAATALCRRCHEEKPWAQMQIDEARHTKEAICPDCLLAEQIGQGKVVK